MHANPAVAAIEARSKLAVFGSVALDIGIKEKKIAPAHLHAPHFGMNGTVTGIDLNHNRPAVGADRSFHGELADVGFEILLVLPALAVEALPEISLAVKQTYAHQGDP